MSITYSDVYGAFQSLPANAPFNSIDFDEDLQLLWPSQSQDPANTLTPIIKFMASQANLTVALPNATLVGNPTILIIGSGENPFSLTDFDGTQIRLINPGEAWFLILEENDTQAGTWIIVPFSTGSTAVTAVGVNQPASGFTIVSNTTNPITGMGNFTFALNDDLAGVENINSVGIAVRTGASTWTTRQINTTNNNITITNPQGIAGNFVLTLNNDITALNSIAVGNFLLQGNAINVTNVNGTIDVGSPVQLIGGLSVRFLNNAGTFYTAISGPTAAIANLNFTLPSSVGGNNAIMQGSATGNLSFSELTTVIANKITMETPVSTINPIVPATMFHHQGVVKASATFDGTQSPPAINYNNNIAQVAKDSTGIYTVNFINNFTDTNYIGFGNACVLNTAPTAPNIPIVNVVPINSGQVKVYIVSNGAFTDYSLINICFYGKLQ